MRRPLLIAAITMATATVVLLFASPGQSADLKVSKHDVARSECGASGCRRSRIAYGCPDTLSCYSLYGAYGPYGGAAYWGTYSFDMTPPR
jgi:hypothetical protein